MTDSDVVKEGAQQASSQLGDCLALGKEAALQLGSQMAEGEVLSSLQRARRISARC